MGNTRTVEERKWHSGVKYKIFTIYANCNTSSTEILKYNNACSIVTRIYLSIIILLVYTLLRYKMSTIFCLCLLLEINVCSFLSLCLLLKINVYTFLSMSTFENKCLHIFVRVSTFENKCLKFLVHVSTFENSSFEIVANSISGGHSHLTRKAQVEQNAVQRPAIQQVNDKIGG